MVKSNACRAPRRAPIHLTILCAIAATLPVQTANGSEDEVYERLLAEKTAALVTVKYVLKMSAPGFGERESEEEVTGVMIDPKGLVLCANTSLGGGGRNFRGMTAQPTDLKVLVGDDTEGRDATLIAKDSELDLAWLQIKEPGDDPFTHLDLADAAEVQRGQRVFALRRLGKYFGRATFVAGGRVGGVTQKPRRLYVPDGGFVGEFGVPVFTEQGQFVGLSVVQLPDAEDAALQRAAMSGGRAGLILPAAEVSRATQQAREVASEDETE